MSELQASNKHGPLVPVLSPLGRKTHLPKSLKCEGKLPASLRHSPSSLQAFDRTACLVKQGKWSLMPGVWRKVVQGLGRSVSNQDGAWQSEERGVWTAGCREQERTLYLLWPSLTISDSEMKGTVGRRQSLSAKGALTSESLMPPPSSLNLSPQQPCLSASQLRTALTWSGSLASIGGMYLPNSFLFCPVILKSLPSVGRSPQMVKPVEALLFIWRHLLFLCLPPTLQLCNNEKPCLPHFHSDPCSNSNIYATLQLVLSLHTHPSVSYSIAIRGGK